MSYALENIKAYQQRQKIETIKTIAYHCAEFLTVVGIFAFGIAIITII